VRVAQELLVSPVGKEALLTSGFGTVLDRGPTPQESLFYGELMDQGIYLRQIIASLLAGNEFYKKATTSSSS